MNADHRIARPERDSRQGGPHPHICRSSGGTGTEQRGQRQAPPLQDRQTPEEPANIPEDEDGTPEDGPACSSAARVWKLY